MPNTYTLIASSTVGSGGAASIAFSSIAGTYTDLALYVSARSTRTTGGTDNLRLEINGSAANFTYRFIDGDGTGNPASSASGSTNFVAQLPQNGGSTGWTTSTFASTLIYIPNYAGSTNKSISVDTTTENNAITSYADLIALLWSQTAAITSLTLKTGSGSNLTQYSTAYLYGVKNA